MNWSAIPCVGDCGSSFLSDVFSFIGSSCLGAVALWKVLNVSVNFERLLKKESICSESLILLMSGFTLSEKSGFCER